MRRWIVAAMMAAVAIEALAVAGDTVRVAPVPGAGDCTAALAAAVEACRESGAGVLLLDSGRYDIWSEHAARREYFISNTSSEEECPSKVKTIGLLLKDIDGLTIDGQGAVIVLHGKMTMVVIDNCSGVTLRNMSFDFERPGGSELTYIAADSTGVVARFHPDSRYEITPGGGIALVGEGWRSERVHCVEYDPSNGHFTHSGGWDTLSRAKAAHAGPGVVRFATESTFRPKVGNTITMRDITRDQVGMFISGSRCTTLEDVSVRYMHAMGIVCQYSRDITMRRVACAPAPGSGRLLASSADFMHFSGCSGAVTITGCRFEGAHDDAINVHGTNLRVVERRDECRVVVRFMHPQSYGYETFFIGDTVAMVDAESMLRVSTAVVEAVSRIDDRNIELTLDSPLPAGLAIGRDCIENLTCTPAVEIRHCLFTRTSTRGVLVTTPRQVVIADNTFLKTGMSAILIEGDAAGWYESGPVRDVTIERNTFVDCAYQGGPEKAVIALNPSNSVIDPKRPVHSGIRVEGNTFVTHGNTVLYAKSTAGITFAGNDISLLPLGEAQQRPLLVLNGCNGVTVAGNSAAATVNKTVAAVNMEPEGIVSDFPAGLQLQPPVY